MKQEREYPRPIRVEVVKGKITVVKDKTVIVKPAFYN